MLFSHRCHWYHLFSHQSHQCRFWFLFLFGLVGENRNRLNHSFYQQIWGMSCKIILKPTIFPLKKKAGGFRKWEGHKEAAQ